ncbi:hypothetical protein A1D31_36825 [Bradyrhizobium liaoningense]|nr:hypothetical protein A1D31_36825 [Bradyrhizobium liaoningense]
MSGHFIEAECDCGFCESLFVGASSGIAYTEGASDIATFDRAEIASRNLSEIPDPFLVTCESGARDYWTEHEQVEARKLKPFGSYLCPKCKRASLFLRFAGNWDGIVDGETSSLTPLEQRGSGERLEPSSGADHPGGVAYPYGLREHIEDLWESTLDTVGKSALLLIKLTALFGAFYLMGFLAEKLCGGTNCINL